jgi:DNA repair photolyase
MKIMIVEEVQARSLLSKRVEADDWFHSNHSMNLYRGCQFACAYCDGMAEHYYVDNFQNHIRVKTNAPEILTKELERLYQRKTTTLFDYSPRKKEIKKPIIGVSGGVSDSYQQTEKRHKITEKILKILLDQGYPLFILTKSDMVLRDIELLKKINEKAFANVCFSITQTDDETRPNYEPGSSSTSERFEALKTLRREGIHGGVMAMPIIPYICDSVENMQSLVKESKKAQAEFVLFSGLTLKPGRQKQHFLNTVIKHNPDHYEGIKKVYSNNARYGQPNWDELPFNVMLVGHAICRENGVNPRSVRHNCRNEFESNHRVLERLLDMKYWKSTILKERKHQWSDLHVLASSIEYGVEDLKDVNTRGVLSKYVRPELLSLVQDTVNKRKSRLYEELVKKVDILAQIEHERASG